MQSWIGSTLIKKIWAFLRGGTSGFYKSELAVLASVIDLLPKPESEILKMQVEAASLIQRHNPGRLVAAYYPKNSNVPVLPYSGYEYCLAKVSYKLNGKVKTTNVVLHNGVFMSFEKNVPQKNDIIQEIKKVSLHPHDYKPVAQEINSVEHANNA